MTDKKDEALKLALQALEYISSHYMSLPKIGCMALAVVEEALAEPAQQQEPVASKQTFTRAEVIRAIEAERHACSIAVWMTLMEAAEPGADDKGLDGWMREAEQRIKNRSANDPEPAQQQEPVFWYRPVGDDGGYEGPIHNSAIEKVRKMAGTWKPLYTSPPASKPLTDDQIMEMYNEPRSDAEMIEFARAIEAAHGIKGDA